MTHRLRSSMVKCVAVGGVMLVRAAVAQACFIDACAPCLPANEPLAMAGFTSDVQPLTSRMFDIEIAAFAYAPSRPIVGQGTVVRWTNADSIEHTVTSQATPGSLVTDGRFDSGSMGLGDTFGFPFDAVGVSHYFCLPHGSSMQASVDVRRPGDANGDGAVNFADLVTLAQNYNQNVSDRATGFAEGDFDLDGVVNFADLVILAQNYNQPADLAADGATLNADFARQVLLVPEPTLVAAFGVVSVALLRQRRRSREVGS